MRKFLKEMVGAPRFELGTSWSRTKRATRLRYAPKENLPLPRRPVSAGRDSILRPKPGAWRQHSKLVGTARFELATPCTPSKCATRLRYVPSSLWTLPQVSSSGLQGAIVHANICAKALSRWTGVPAGRRTAPRHPAWLETDAAARSHLASRWQGTFAPRKSCSPCCKAAV